MKWQDSVEKIRCLLKKVERDHGDQIVKQKAPDGYVDRKTACRLLVISETALRKKVDKGYIASISRGWRVYFSIADIRVEIFRQIDRRLRGITEKSKKNPFKVK